MSDPYLAVVAIVKDEEPHIDEWLAFHTIVGVEHFHIYDNGSSDRTVAKLLASDASVTVLGWPGEAQQLPAYSHALSHCQAQWLAFIDIDEFLYSPTYVPLPTLLRNLEEYEAIGACWATFGTSGQLTPAPNDTLRCYQYRADNVTTHINYHVKSIVQRDFVRSTRVDDPHHFDCDGVDENGVPLNGPFPREVTWRLFKINHYISRSITEAEAKLRQPRADNGELRDMDLLGKALNATRDTDILPYAPLLDRMLVR